MGASSSRERVSEKLAPMGRSYGEWRDVTDCGLMVKGGRGRAGYNSAPFPSRAPGTS